MLFITEKKSFKNCVEILELRSSTINNELKSHGNFAYPVISNSEERKSFWSVYVNDEIVQVDEVRIRIEWIDNVDWKERGNCSKTILTAHIFRMLQLAI